MTSSSTLIPFLNFSTSTPPPSPNSIRFTTINHPSRKQPQQLSSTTCRASSSSSSATSITDFDLYDLLGVDSSSDLLEIKKAYRSLQKRCHPDIAGPAGHDMAIILNEVYALLSDPNSRLAYDKSQAKASDLKGYTGKPIYSVWMGSESEQRAVFVDEVKCVGCLKCALFADKTFAIESVYGRARVVAQWADPEHKIVEAIEACPVDCISVVERSNLAALEFLMSKQPRGTVSMSSGNAVGARVSNIFTDLTKFQNKYNQSLDKAFTNGTKEADLQRQAKMSAIQAIRSISNWLYWRTPRAGSETSLELTHIARKFNEPDLDKLREAVEAKKRANDFKLSNKQTPSTKILNEEYWTPINLSLPSSPETNLSTIANEAPTAPPPTPKRTKSRNINKGRKARFEKTSLVKTLIPFVAGLVAAIYVRAQAGESQYGILENHIAGSLVLDIVNSFWLQTALAGVTWYCIGLYVIELVEALGRKD